MEQKALDILVVEDQESNIRDAQNFLLEQQKLGSPICVDYTSTLKAAQDRIREKRYDGIITDIFFPYDDTEQVDKIKGYNPDTAKLCFEMLGKEITSRFYKSRLSWLEGRNIIHPSGIVLASYGIENNIPVVMITDTDHHGEFTDPINLWGMNKCHDGKRWQDYLIDGTKLKDGRYQKRWSDAYKELIEEYFKEQIAPEMRGSWYNSTPEMKASLDERTKSYLHF